MRTKPSRNGNGVHHPAEMAIGGDAMMFNRVKRLIGEVVERRTRAEMVGNSASLARSTWNDAGTEDSLDPRRSIWDECGYPATRFMTPQRWQILHDRNVVASTINEVATRCVWQVKPSVYEKEPGKVLTGFDKAYANLSMNLRSGGMPDYFGDDGGDPLTECWERADGLCGVSRFGLIVYGLDDGLGWDKPVAGIEEYGSQPGEQELDDEGKPVLDAKKQPIVNVNRGDERRYEIVRNAEIVKGRKLGYVNAFPESLVYPNRWETNKQSPRFGRPVSYRVTFVNPSHAMIGTGLPLSTEQVHWTRCQHIADWGDTYDSSLLLCTPRCQVPLNNIMALDKLYHGGPEGFWKHCFPYLFLETHPQLGGDVEVDDDALKDMIEEMMNGLQKAGVTTGMAAKTVGGSVADPTAQVNLHLAAIAMKKRMPVRVLAGAMTGGLGSTGPAETEDDQWDDQVKKRQNGWVTSGVIRPSVNQLIWYGVLPPPEGSEKIKRFWPDVTKMSAERQASVAAQRAAAMSTYVNGGIGQIMSLFDFYVKELGMTEEDAKARIDAVIGEAQQDMGDEPENVIPPEIADWVPPEATEGEGEDAPQAEGEMSGAGLPNFTGNTWSDASREAALEARRSKAAAIGGKTMEKIPKFVFRTEEAHSAYKGKAHYGEGLYTGLSQDQVAEMTVDPHAETEQPLKYHTVRTLKVPKDLHVLEMDEEAIHKTGLTGDALKKAVLDSGHHAVRIKTDDLNRGGDQLVIYKTPNGKKLPTVNQIDEEDLSPEQYQIWSREHVRGSSVKQSGRK